MARDESWLNDTFLVSIEPDEVGDIYVAMIARVFAFLILHLDR